MKTYSELFNEGMGQLDKDPSKIKVSSGVAKIMKLLQKNKMKPDGKFSSGTTTEFKFKKGKMKINVNIFSNNGKFVSAEWDDGDDGQEILSEPKFTKWLEAGMPPRT